MTPGEPPGRLGEEEDDCEQVELIITPIHLRWTLALRYEGASERRPGFDESPLKLAVAGGSRASVTPHAPIHHLIRTLRWSSQALGLPMR